MTPRDGSNFQLPFCFVGVKEQLEMCDSGRGPHWLCRLLRSCLSPSPEHTMSHCSSQCPFRCQAQVAVLRKHTDYSYWKNKFESKTEYLILGSPCGVWGNSQEETLSVRFLAVSFWDMDKHNNSFKLFSLSVSWMYLTVGRRCLS